VWLSYSDGNNSSLIGIGHRRNEGGCYFQTAPNFGRQAVNLFMPPEDWLSRRIWQPSPLADTLSTTECRSSCEGRPRQGAFRKQARTARGSIAAPFRQLQRGMFALHHPAQDQGACRSSPLDRGRIRPCARRTRQAVCRRSSGEDQVDARGNPLCPQEKPSERARFAATSFSLESPAAALHVRKSEMVFDHLLWRGPVENWNERDNSEDSMYRQSRMASRVISFLPSNP
jgi:hypothetical protein